MRFIRDILAALVVAVLGTTAALITHALNLKSELFVSYVIQLAIAVVILLILGIKSHFDRNNNDQNTLVTFFTDELLPNKVKRTLGLESHIVVIEDKGSLSVYESFRRQFPQKTEFVKKHFLADSSNTEDSKTRLEDSLSGAKSVIVVRTKELEKNRSLYQAGTTEEERVLTNYPVDQRIKPSVIGCAFAHRNYSVQWFSQTQKATCLTSRCCRNCWLRKLVNFTTPCSHF